MSWRYFVAWASLPDHKEISLFPYDLKPKAIRPACVTTMTEVLHIDRSFFDVTHAEQVLVNDAAAGPMKNARRLGVIPQQVSLVGR